MLEPLQTVKRCSTHTASTPPVDTVQQANGNHVSQRRPEQHDNNFYRQKLSRQTDRLRPQLDTTTRPTPRIPVALPPPDRTLQLSGGKKKKKKKRRIRRRRRRRTVQAEFILMSVSPQTVLNLNHM
ncbi:hypothetical protein F2P81_008391 [Scophthalmus maximus]|uniref:Uncharacterized protein n=1 Tax=Scophthalmus maximus TaxID=52904 RepID=A0A6A4SY47_SCOMX|nr:hypothetical protein F2P81_008391 [Scophthalmus maximus]